MFTDTLSRYLASVQPAQTATNLRAVLSPLFDRMSSRMLTSAGLVITGAAGTTAKSGASDAYMIVNGTLSKLTAGTAMPALVGSVASTKFNVFCFFSDGTTRTSAMGIEGASLGAADFPQFPERQALIGFIIINPTGTGPFVGGTTALDDATVVPNAIYVSPVSGFDPNCLIG